MNSEKKREDLKQLAEVEKKLHGILDKINQELSRNEVEYLHINSLIEMSKNQTAESDIASKVQEVTGTTSSMKLEVNNFEPSWSTDMDLRPIVETENTDMEFDSD